jgi:hypothetical protein
MLDGVKRFMHEKSLLIITTPNPWSRARIKLIKGGILEDKWLNPEHTCWFTFGTLTQLLHRKGYYFDFRGYYSGYTKCAIQNKSFSHRWLKMLYRSIKVVKEYEQDGLFFVVKLRTSD